ncbi:putative mitochondrial protein AtMg00860 [Bidens hawaiensis]|uniref:putative mitochondrial protein AtMg00860 n=1 Tax=Bidens hawaiensis TaxID=980011 RepID=UPI00404A4E6D
MKLNPCKCSFGVEEGKFLGVLVTKEGIKANPEKLEALLQMSPPRNIKEVQRLKGRLVVLKRFLKRIVERTLPFMAVLRRNAKKNKFCWNTEDGKAFQELKAHLYELPTIVTPQPGEVLVLYPSYTGRTISSVLMVERGKPRYPYTLLVAP